MAEVNRTYFLLLVTLCIVSLIWTSRFQLISPFVETHYKDLKKSLIYFHNNYKFDFKKSKLNFKNSYIYKKSGVSKKKSSEIDILREELKFVGNIPESKDPFNSDRNRTEMFDFKKDIWLQDCGLRPKLLDIEISNDHWQVVRLPGGSKSASLIFAYGAYLDTREKDPVVRVLITSEVYWKETSLPDRRPKFCQLWYSNMSGPVIMKMALSEDEIPESVSLVENLCDQARNELKINYKVPQEKKDFGVCVKGLDLMKGDFSTRMVHWIEMLGILGAQGIHFHQFSVHENVARANIPLKRRHEVIAYNDCFLTHMYTYRYIALIDIDEVIVPKDVSSWKELIQDIEATQKVPASFCFHMVLFIDKIVNKNETLATAPDIDKHIEGYPYMMNKLNHELKTVCYGGGTPGSKCFHNTDNVLMVHNHYPRTCLLKGNCVSHQFNAYVHHHKESCVKDGHNETLGSHPFVYDPRIRFFKDQLISRSDKALQEIGL